MKRVLQVLGSLQRGGAETMVMNVYRHIDRTQVQFDFLVKERVKDGYEQEIESLGGRIICVSSPKIIGTFRYILQVRKAILENGAYCAVHSHMNVISGLIMVAAYCAGVKNRIAHSHSTNFPNTCLVNNLGKFLIGVFSTQRAACSKQAGDALFGLKAYNVIPNGIDTKKYIVNSEEERISIRNNLNFAKNQLHICHIGRFVDVKNHKYIIELAENLKKANCKCIIHLLGDGELFGSIQKMAMSKQLDNVIFHGSVSNVADFLKASDIFILPSKYEGVPLSVIEAQCAGLMCYLSTSISDECDLGIGLVEYLPLDIDKWSSRINAYKASHSCEVKNMTLTDAIINTGVDIQYSGSKLLSLY